MQRCRQGLPADSHRSPGKVENIPVQVDFIPKKVDNFPKGLF